MGETRGHYSAVVIGSGFGGALTALPLARAFKERGKGERLLMLERGTWWTTPVETVQDKRVAALAFLQERGFRLAGYDTATTFDSDGLAAVYLQRTQGMERAA